MPASPRLALLPLFFVPTLIIACGDSGTGTSTSSSSSGGAAASSTSAATTSTGGSGGAPEPITWTSCALDQSSIPAECATIPEPLDRKNPAGKSISFFVKRIPAATQPARGQLWLLQGGPGLSGASLEFVVPQFVNAASDLDIYLPDHRGVGASSSLDCAGFDIPITGAAKPPSQADVVSAGTACRDKLLATWGSLDGFSAEEAAADVGETINRTRADGQAVFLWGTSYGTRWALRYLQQFPTQASGVVLDSVESEASSFTDYGAQLEAQSAVYLATCTNDTTCNAKLGGNPTTFLSALLTKLDSGYCPTSQNLVKSDYRLLFGETLTLQQGLRDILPALLYRVDRCNAADQAAILTLRNLYAQSAAATAPQASGVLNAHITLSEIYDTSPPALSTLLANDLPRGFSMGDAPFYRALYDIWPRYDASPYRNNYPSTTVPILMLEGSLDPSTPPAEAQTVAAALTAPHQTLVLLANAAHGNLFQSPTSGGTDCAATIFTQFITDPTKDLDTSCKSMVVKPNFDNSQNAFLFGTTSIWD